MVRHFRMPIAFALVCFALAGWYGFARGGAAGMADVLWIVAVLSVLEISLSFDNAVVNATVLQDMDPLWQKRFLTWGMVIAVYGMYIVFPLAIVAIAAGLGPVETIRLSLTQPATYEHMVSSAHTGIAGFGGAFLGLVGLQFFFDREKEVHWIAFLEHWAARFSALPALEIVAVLLALWGISTVLPAEQALRFVTAGLFGVIAFVLVEGLGEVLEQRDERLKATGQLLQRGFGGFIYLNVLDASFSFDGVIGAFALTNSMVVIALGLSIGAMFVRSLTLLLVEKGTLAEYRYLEHGAFWAILALSAIMLLSVRYDIPETLTGLVGAVLIGVSLWWSVRHKRRATLAMAAAAMHD